MRFEKLSYANDRDPRLKRWIIRTIEGLSGRDRFVDLYETWRSDIARGEGGNVFGRMLELIDVRMRVNGQWPPKDLTDAPVVIVANHPYGIGDGIAVLALAEQLGRPFRVLINNELLKVPELEPYSLPVSFEETKEALELNMKTRHEAVRLLKQGVTVVVFPAGGVATAKNAFGRAEDLPWKIFTAKLVQAAKANVIPVYFEGQNGRLFHIASKFSLTLRISLLIREFRKLSGSMISSTVGGMIYWDELSRMPGRQDILSYLHQAVFSLAPSVGRAAEAA